MSKGQRLPRSSNLKYVLNQTARSLTQHSQMTTKTQKVHLEAKKTHTCPKWFQIFDKHIKP
ncbi:hypothetical protein Hanom_Chr09g00812781 [Helianthus anomalus]